MGAALAMKSKSKKKKTATARLRMKLMYVKVPQTLHDDAERAAAVEGLTLAAIARRWMASGQWLHHKSVTGETA